MTRIPAGDRELLGILDDGFRRIAAEAGPLLKCGPGCDSCCREPFPITSLDRERLRRAWLRLATEEPARARTVAERAGQVRSRFAEGYPGDPVTGTLTACTEVLDGFLARHGGVACPVLDPQSGRCELYDARPVACRTFGPPLKFGDRKSAPCDLCFAESTPEVVERHRWEPDPEGLEQRLLSRAGVTSDEDWETMIAYAIPDPGVGDV